MEAAKHVPQATSKLATIMKAADLYCEAQNQSNINLGSVRVRIKMGGGMEAHKNNFIEDWSTARENLEHNFRWTRRNLALVGIFGIALPVLVYKGIVREFVSSSLLFS